MTLSEELTWRGFVNQTTIDDLRTLDTEPRTFYLGFDASADSQTVGNLAAMMFAKCYLRHNYKGVLLAGGSTSLIGDPGGKDKERILQSEETIAHNVARAAEQLQIILRGHDFKLVNNLDWTRDLPVLTFLRDIGKHFSMTPLVQRDYIANRIGEGGVGISYTEFSYTILQGMDYLHLYDTEGVTLQLGGSDQWGNCLSGVELIRRARGASVDVMTLNLFINKATGKKFGKSEDGAIWLDPAKTSPTQFYQFWINVDDEGVEGYLKIVTELQKDEVDKIMAMHQADKSARYAQIQLARQVTALVHGAEQMEAAELVTQYLTGAQPIAEADERIIQILRSEMPVVSSSADGSLLEVLVSASLAASVSEARRLIQGNAVAINGEKVARETLQSSDFTNGRLLVKKGKKFRDAALVELQ
ncbi:MAG TPA: tyrosine--tRNA ligase [Candidatus Saccharimonadales bacterium]|jgi:tyrosyl-tRNA synthetase